MGWMIPELTMFLTMFFSLKRFLSDNRSLSREILFIGSLIDTRSHSIKQKRIYLRDQTDIFIFFIHKIKQHVIYCTLFNVVG